jgi:hypothetical protein
MYYEKFVAALKVNEIFLKDDEGKIKLPFGSEYSLYLKNLESRDAVVSISIDGKDVLGGNQLIVRANSFFDLEGFLNGASVKNKFKFIELTKEIEEYRGYRLEDSLIRIEFRFQKPKPIYHPITYITTWSTSNPVWKYDSYTSDTTLRDGSNYSSSGNSSRSVGCFNVQNTASINDIGITVKGSKSNQNFQSGYIGELEDISHVIILKLSGYKEDKTEVTSYISKKIKLECENCGMICKSSFDYCPRCGTLL